MGTFTIRCWGCNHEETHPWNGPGLEHDALMQELKWYGWIRRPFYKSDWDQGPWFCSEDCAYHSYNAIQAEQYWRDVEFQAYCRKTRVPIYMWIPIILATVFACGIMLGEFFDVRIQ